MSTDTTTEAAEIRTAIDESILRDSTPRIYVKDIEAACEEASAQSDDFDRAAISHDTEHVWGTRDGQDFALYLVRLYRVRR